MVEDVNPSLSNGECPSTQLISGTPKATGSRSVGHWPSKRNQRIASKSAGLPAWYCLFCSCLCLDLPLGADFCIVYLEPSPPPTPPSPFLPPLPLHPPSLPPRPTLSPPPSSSSFRLYQSKCCGGLNSARASLNTGLVLHILLSFFRCFFYIILDPGFCAEHFYTHNLPF